ncbi:hypothetical protein M8C21_027626 [Ambrosia artemisiifolia]|uniref:Uncharacterized protein n=1 Tax=Ambrosia artemisiifolia TaxID=4212 RepID=A0AAD5CNS4_AMBAR|nr:hypothetical protein M8C21_027626 [Ambrosia artemisiifolia]
MIPATMNYPQYISLISSMDMGHVVYLCQRCGWPLLNPQSELMNKYANLEGKRRIHEGLQFVGGRPEASLSSFAALTGKQNVLAKRSEAIEFRY